MVISHPQGGLSPPCTPPHSWWSCVRTKTNDDNIFAPASPKSLCKPTTPKSEGSASSGNQRRNRPIADLEGDACPSRPCSSGFITCSRDHAVISAPAWATCSSTLPIRRHAAERDALLSGMGRSKSLPAWHSELRPRAPAGQSTLEMDQPTASQFLSWSRRHGEPHPWRTPFDGLVLTHSGGRLSSAPPEVSLSNSGRAQIPDLAGRRMPRSPPHRIMRMQGGY